MTRTSPPQVAMSSGEISGLLHRRFDYQRFQTGVAACRGFLPMAEGALTRAPGTWHRGRTHNDQPARLVPFQFAADDALQLEFTPGIMRVWRYGSLVMGAGVPYTLATPFTVEDLPNLRWVQSADVLYLCDGAHPIQRLARAALNSWSIGPQNFDTGPFRVQNLDESYAIQANAASGLITLTSSRAYFTADHVGQLLRIRSVDNTAAKHWMAGEKVRIGDRRRYNSCMYQVAAFDNSTGRTGSGQPLIWPSSPPISVTDGQVEWTKIADGNPFGASPWAQYEYVSLGQRRYFSLSDLTAEATSIVATAAGERSVGTYPPVHTEGSWMADDGGVIWRYLSDDTGIVRIKTRISATQATADVLRAVPQDCVTSPTYRWSEGAWTPAYGYPSAIELYEQRLVAAATDTEPRTVWFSTVGDFGDFLDGVEADEAFAYTISGNGSINRILNLHAARSGLHIFALGEEYSTRSESRAQTIGPTTAVFGRDSAIGASPARPISPAGDPIFISRDRRRVQVISYSLESDANRAQDVSRPARHLGADRFEEIVWQGVPMSTAWLRTGAGDLVAMVYDPAEEILGWAQVSVAGGVVESMAVTPAADGSLDVVTLVVRRDIGGETFRFIEEQAMPYGPLATELDPSEACHLFAAVRFTPNVPTQSFSIPHLGGQAVCAWTDEGNVLDLAVAEDGDLTLPHPVNWAVIGLFDSAHHIETLDITAQAQDGSTMGRQKRMQDRSGVGLYATAALRVQAVEREMGKPTKVAAAVDLLTRPIAAAGATIVSGVSNLLPPTGHAIELSYRFIPVGGAPATLTAIVPTVQEAGR